MTLENWLRQCIEEINQPKQSFGQRVFDVLYMPLGFLAIFAEARREGLGATITAVILFFCWWAITGGLGLEVSRAVYPDLDSMHMPLILTILGSLVSMYVFTLILFIGLRATNYNRRRGKLLKKYRRQHGGQLMFSSQTYTQAAQVLEKYKKKNYNDGVAAYGQEVMDLLIIVQALDEFDGLWRRLVSIRSILEDREAD